MILSNQLWKCLLAIVFPFRERGASLSRLEVTTRTAQVHFEDVGSDDENSNDGNRVARRASQLDHSITVDFDDLAFENSYDALRLFLIYFGIYVIIAVLAFSLYFEPTWTVIDAIYFAIVTFTTTGYGDLTPTTEGGKIFGMFFALYGIVILGIFLGIMGHTLGQMQSEALKELGHHDRKKVLHSIFSHEEHDFDYHHHHHDNDEESHDEQPPLYRNQSSSSDNFLSGTNLDKDDHSHDPPTLRDEILKVIMRETPILAVLMAIAVIYGYFKGWSIVDSLYYCVMSFSTIGYGDITPTTQGERLWSIVFLPIAVAVFGEVVGRIASLYCERKNQIAQDRLLTRSVTLADFQQMDDNHNGMVSREDFMKYMLIHVFQHVDQDLWDRLDDVFYSLLARKDHPGGGNDDNDSSRNQRQTMKVPVISKEQIVRLAKRPKQERERLQRLASQIEREHKHRAHQSHTGSGSSTYGSMNYQVLRMATTPSK